MSLSISYRTILLTPISVPVSPWPEYSPTHPVRRHHANPTKTVGTGTDVQRFFLRLRNSQVANARLRLVGIQVIEENFPTSGGTLSKVKTLFAEGMKEFGADLVAAYSNAPSGNSAGGWGYTPGRYSVQQVRTSGAFRHEIAHNVGGSHCNNGKNSYKFGYSNGKSKTALCGNKVAYYSTPLLSDEHGLPLGDSAKADMARLWREQAAKMSSYAQAVVPIDD